MVAQTTISTRNDLAQLQRLEDGPRDARRYIRSAAALRPDPSTTCSFYTGSGRPSTELRCLPAHRRSFRLRSYGCSDRRDSGGANFRRCLSLRTSSAGLPNHSAGVLTAALDGFDEGRDCPDAAAALGTLARIQGEGTTTGDDM